MKKMPSKEDILQWIQDHPDKTSKRDIGKAFGIKGAARIDLKRILKELTAEGHLTKTRKTYDAAGALPPVSVLRMLSPDKDGDLWAAPMEWNSDDPEPKIYFVAKKGDPALKEGDRVLCRLTPSPDPDIDYDARLIRRLAGGPQKIIGLYRLGSEGGRIVPVDKKSTSEWTVSKENSANAKDGELVEAEQTGPKSRMGLPSARITDVLGDPMAPKAVSLIAIHQHGIPDDFPDAVIAEAEAAEPVELRQRKDLRDLPLFTIDPSDARDHDDAICALPDDDPKNAGGHIVWVAIADVAHYVQGGSQLDKEARKRGNSSYFPDRVVPMLPDALSGDLCSLHEGVDRACMAVRIVLDSKGQKLGHEFFRGLMRSPASLSYEQAQAASQGDYDEATKLLAKAIDDLFAAYASATKARNLRQPLNLDLPERQIVLSDEGKVMSVAFKERFDAHKLVEEFMVTANVCAAETLEAKKQPLIYRVHEEPTPEKLETLREVADSAGLQLAKGQGVKTQHLNKLLDGAAGSEDAEVINMTVLRSMKQAYYAPDNLGHFGLNLRRYAHFTSPIRRYADLIVHRALITAHGWGDDGLTADDVEELAQTGEWISETERRSMLAERDTTDRYLAAFLSERVGNEFEGRVSGIAKFGLFVKLLETGADGIIPLAHLGREYWRYNERDGTLKGDESNRIIAVGMPCKVSLVDATAVTGGLTLEMLELDGKPMPKGTGGKKFSRSRKPAAKGKSRKRVLKRRR
ncbi:ribonuclease R [Amylibacter sp. SFDW26]|uniref:ribonuclease R n=1 Tax=Amylibacter sp. SFDW26 TaxID=2652722 RepID=UPI0012621C13|nr:ribonuclease R [Amylibacter sp. SFDW26]KAB7614360.1 ribonuclease R [Amylibacter sp. SFDW26]